MLANLCLLLMSVCCSFEWWKRAVCNVWYRCLDQLKQTACLKLLWKICNSITLSWTKASAIGSLSFMSLEVCTCSTILFPAVGRTRKNCRRKTIVTTNFFVSLLWCGRHIITLCFGHRHSLHNERCLAHFLVCSYFAHFMNSDQAIGNILNASHLAALAAFAVCCGVVARRLYVKSSS